MPGENPIIKFSPFEALMIGEKNKIAKRKPMKNAIFVTRLTHKKKPIDLRELFDVKEEDGVGTTHGKKSFRKKGSANGFLKCKKTLRDIKTRDKKGKSQSNSDVYCYEFEGHKVVIKENELLKIGRRCNKIKSGKVKFKPDFKFKETLEERIVHKIQKRKKTLKSNLVQNVMLSKMKKGSANRHCLRGKNGKFIRREEYEEMSAKDGNTKAKCLTDYLKSLYKKKSVDVTQKSKEEYPVLNDLMRFPKKRMKLDINRCENILDDISNQYYKKLFSKNLKFPPVPKPLEISDFDSDDNLLAIVCEYQQKPMLRASESFVESIENTDTVREKKGLRIYERKRSTTANTNRNDECFNNSSKENHCVNKSVNMLNNSNDNVVTLKGRRNCINYLIDERPTKDNQLIMNNRFRSLFYKTACGSETYLGNLIKPVLLNSSFGRLPDIS